MQNAEQRPLSPAELPDLLNAKQCAELLRLPLVSFYRNVRDGRFPAPAERLTPRRSRWSKAAILNLLEAGKVCNG